MNNLKTSESKDYMIEKFIKHENYGRYTGENDIAVIKLSRDVSFNDPKNLRPACLWQTVNIPKTTAVASGWGQTMNNNAKSLSDDLMKVKLNIFDQNICLNFYKDSGFKFNKNQICAGNLQGGRDTCQGGRSSKISFL